MSYEQDYLLMLTDDQIEYSSLSEPVLRQLALDVEPYIAQSALTELLLRESNEAVATACHILSGTRADRYLRATALKILFRMERDKALDYMIEHAPSSDPYVLNKMMTLIVYESDFKYELAATRLIAQRLQKVEQEEKEEFLESEVLEDFEQFFDTRDSLLSKNGDGRLKYAIGKA